MNKSGCLKVGGLGVLFGIIGALVGITLVFFSWPSQMNLMEAIIYFTLLPVGLIGGAAVGAGIGASLGGLSSVRKDVISKTEVKEEPRFNELTEKGIEDLSEMEFKEFRSLIPRYFFKYSNYSTIGSLQEPAGELADIVARVLTRLEGRSNEGKESDLTFALWGLSADTINSNTDDAHRSRGIICFETIHGSCYLMMCDNSFLRVAPDIVCLRFIGLLDMELEKKGITRLSYEQKEKTLEAIGLNIKDWKLYTYDG